MRNRNRITLLLLLCLLPLTGCATLRALMPGGVTPADAEWEGTVAGPPISILGTLDSRLEVAASLAQALGQTDPVGVLLPVLVKDEAQPRYVICTGDFTERCRGYSLHQLVEFAGRSSGPFWRPARLAKG